MADTTSGAEVISIMENLKQIVLSKKPDPNPGIIDGSVRDLYTELQALKTFMRKLTEKQNHEEHVKRMMIRIRELVREAEDAIETSIVEEKKRISRSGLDKVVRMVEYKSGQKNLEKKMYEIGSKVRDFYQTSSPVTSQIIESTTRSVNGRKQVKSADLSLFLSFLSFLFIHCSIEESSPSSVKLVNVLFCFFFFLGNYLFIYLL